MSLYISVTEVLHWSANYSHDSLRALRGIRALKGARCARGEMTKALKRLKSACCPISHGEGVYLTNKTGELERSLSRACFECLVQGGKAPLQEKPRRTKD
ncbi:hypothetical protein VTO42DRAFT_3924 [Malbranchea cinnamomea]